MPQININEIDESNYVRVENADRLKVLVPGISSFGPVYDGTNLNDDEINIPSFTDKQAFYKVYGYTNPEFDPIEDDHSKLYVESLLDNGAEVTFVRLNKGITAEFNIGVPKEGTDDIDHRVVVQAVKNGKGTIPTTGTDARKYKFCTQILGISAKYSGSFGNNLLISIRPVNSVNRLASYQYASISVYKADFIVNTNATTGVVTKTVKSAMLLENKIVTTNPNDKNYFEDVEFNFITIEASPTAREELSITWSNIAANTVTTDIISGFPEIALTYVDSNGKNVYNTDALIGAMADGDVATCKPVKRGWDFQFSEDLQSVLNQGFGGLVIGNAKYSVANINRYVFECFTPAGTVSGVTGSTVTSQGIIESIFDNLTDCYKNFEDPYIYDFDFITSGGLLNDTYTFKTGIGDEATTVEATDIIAKNNTPTATIVYPVSGLASASTFASVIPVHIAMLNLVETRQDCVALIDTYKDWDKLSLPNYVRLCNSSYATVHAPWCFVNNPYVNELVLMSPSFIFLMTMLNNLITNTDAQKWFPPAGVTRATATIVVKPKYEIGSTVLNAWQNDDLARVNPIMKLKNFGYVIYGQYTTRVAQDANSYSALDCLNVRITANCVKKEIFNTCLKLAFEPNNSSLWIKFYDAMDKYLLYMKRNDGVYDYKIQMDESTVTTDDINQLRCPGKVWINPTRAAEFFDIDFTITEAGVTFNTEEAE